MNTIGDIVKLNLGCGKFVKPGWVNVDVTKFDGVDIIYDLDRSAEIPLPINENSVSEFAMDHVLEHLKNPLAVLQEMYRVAKPNALATIRVPYGTSDDAWEDPTHLRPYYIGSFSYFSQPNYWRTDYGYRGDWRPERISLFVSRNEHGNSSAAEIMHRVRHARNIVREMVVEMRAVKPARPARPELQTAPAVEIEWC